MVIVAKARAGVVLFARTSSWELIPANARVEEIAFARVSPQVVVLAKVRVGVVLFARTNSRVLIPANTRVGEVVFARTSPQVVVLANVRAEVAGEANRQYAGGS